MLFNLLFSLLLFQNAAPCDSMLAQGDKVRLDGKLTEAMALYQQAVTSCPGKATAKWRLARSYLETADDVYNKANGAIPVQKKMSQYKMALRLSMTAIRQDTLEARAWEMAATTYAAIISISSIRQQARLADSVRVYAEVSARLDPKEDTPWHILGRWHYEVARLNWILKMFSHFFFGGAPEGSYQKAEYYLRQAVKAVDAPTNRYWLAQCLEAQGKILQAKKEYEYILEFSKTKKSYHNDSFFVDIARKKLNR
jgi:tetratricopeptide (TPR) repeat protein